jgi:hypothetical protein
MNEPEKPKPKRSQPPAQQEKSGPQQTKQERRKRRRPAPPVRPEPTSPRWAKESGPKICQKCGGRMFPADWIWQKYGLCLGWRCANCKERVMARSLPFKGLRKRALDPDEIAYHQAARAAWQAESSESKPKK